MGLLDRVGLLRRPGQEHREDAHGALEAVGMVELAGRPFDTLSGGQKQRVLLARALAGKPKALLLDEPTAGLDLPGAASILSLLRRLHREGMTVVLVTHQLNEVANLANRVALIMADGIRVGAREQMLTAANLTELYKVPVTTARLNGGLVIIPEVEPGA